MSFKCPHCGEGFVKRGIKEYHVESCAPTVNVKYQETIVTLHRDIDTKKFYCQCSASSCPSYFISARKLREHAATAKSVWPSSDNVCS